MNIVKGEHVYWPHAEKDIHKGKLVVLDVDDDTVHVKQLGHDFFDFYLGCDDVRKVNNMKATEFPIGSTVELIDGTDLTAKIGARATVVQSDHDNEFLHVHWNEADGTGLRGTQTNGGYYPSSFKIIYGDKLMQRRRTFRLLRENHELKKGALVQEACDDGTQDYVTPDGYQDFIKYEDEDGERGVRYPRESVENEPKWFVEVFKANPEYQTKEEQTAFKEFNTKRVTKTVKKGKK